MASSARVVLLGVTIFGLLSVAYVWAAPSLAYQRWDSLEYAWACEARGPRAMWGNHPLGHLVECGAVEAARRLGYQGRALPVMKVVNGVTAAAAATAMLALLNAVLGAPLVRSAGWAVVFGSTYGWWYQAGTADCYSLAVLFLIVAWGATIRALERPSLPIALLAGLAFGAATVAHQFAGVVLAVATLGLLPLHLGRGRARPATLLATLVATAAVVIVVGYTVCGVLATGSASPRTIARWIVGHGMNPWYGRFFNLNLDSAFTAVRAAAATLVGGSDRPPLWVIGLACVAMSVPGAIAIRRLDDRGRIIARSCALQGLAGLLLVTWWEPGQRKFWLLLLPALVVWCELVLAGLARGRAWDGRRRLLEAVPALAGAAMFLATGSIMLKERQPDVAFERALRAWVEHSRPDDVLIENGRLHPHLRFWERRGGATNIYLSLLHSRGGPDRFDGLRTLFAKAAREGRAVLFAPRLSPAWDDRLAVVGVTRRQVEDFFDRYPREGPLFTYQAGEGRESRAVYRLIVPAN